MTTYPVNKQKTMKAKPSKKESETMKIQNQVYAMNKPRPKIGELNKKNRPSRFSDWNDALVFICGFLFASLVYIIATFA